MPILDEPVQLADLFRPGEYRVAAVTGAWQRDQCHALRRQVFCEEQKVFTGDDLDEIDAQCILLAASSCICGDLDEVVGTVRIHQPAPGLWWGSRLAVAKPFRRVGGLGAALIRLAVGTARFNGAETFLAHVQTQNVKLFQSLDWHVLDDKLIHGVPHYLMQADISAYTPIDGTALRVLPAVRARA
jgi:putative N-acetyltransferase (TIGR04045 family)